jgi:hypothetical protein
MPYKVWTSGALSNCSVGADQPPSLTYSGARLRPSSISTSHTSPRIFRTRCPGETRDPGDTRGSSYAVGRERSRVITSYSSPHAENHAPPTHQNGLRFYQTTNAALHDIGGRFYIRNTGANRAGVTLDDLQERLDDVDGHRKDSGRILLGTYLR